MKKLSKLLFTVVFTIAVLLSACTKLDTKDNLIESENIDYTNKFFTIPPSTEYLVKRVIDEIKNRNNSSEFVNSFAKNNGFPIWDKVLTISAKHRNNTNQGFDNYGANSAVTNNDTIILIPLVLNNQSNVHGFIRATLHDNIGLNYCLEQDYKNYTFSNSSSEITANKFASTIMYLDMIVFGQKDFKITDKKLYNNSNNYADTANTTKIIKFTNTRDNPVIAYVCYEQTVISTVDIRHCTHSGSCTSGVCDNCEYCHHYAITWEVFSVCYGEEMGGGPPAQPSGDGGSGGGGSGPTGIPHSYPCPVIITPPPIIGGGGNSGYENSVVPPSGVQCTPPTGGTGWTIYLPQSFNINNPCNVVDSLLKTANFKQNLKTLRDSCVKPYEIGISFKNPFVAATYSINNYSGQFAKDSLSVSMDIPLQSDGAMHSHNNNPARLPNASADDLAQNWGYQIDGKIRDIKTFTYTVVTNNTAYIFMISDSTKFMNFGQNYTSTDDVFRSFQFLLHELNKYGKDGLTNSENETNFLRALANVNDGAGAGLKVFRGNPSMTVFDPIKISSNNQSIILDPCN